MFNPSGVESICFVVVVLHVNDGEEILLLAPHSFKSPCIENIREQIFLNLDLDCSKIKTRTARV